jgi:hypothetical protein
VAGTVPAGAGCTTVGAGRVGAAESAAGERCCGAIDAPAAGTAPAGEGCDTVGAVTVGACSCWLWGPVRSAAVPMRPREWPPRALAALVTTAAVKATARRDREALRSLCMGMCVG